MRQIWASFQHKVTGNVQSMHIYWQLTQDKHQKYSHWHFPEAGQELVFGTLHILL